VSSISFHPKENILVSSGLDRKVKIFEVAHRGGNMDQRNNLDSSEKARKI